MIDRRQAQDIFEEVGNRLADTTGWSRTDKTAQALIRIFSRYSEIVIDNLNRVPDKNFLAFMNLLGVTPVPAVAARVPLTFFPVDGA